MAHSEFLASAEFDNFVVHPRLPNAKLSAEYFFGGDFAQSSINIANTAQSLTEIDVPVYGDNYAEVQCGLSGFDIGIDPDAESTMICVLSQPNTGATNVAMAGYKDINFAVGRSNSDTRIRCGEGAANRGAFFPQTNVWTGAVGTTYGFFALQNKGTPNREQYYGAAGAIVKVTSNFTFSTKRPPSVAVIGGPTMTSSTSNTKFRVAYFAHYQRFLSEAELLQAYVNVKSSLLSRGIAVT